MADTKISGLAAGAPAQAGDLIPIARSGANYSITPANILAYGTSPVAGTSGTFSTTLGVTGASTLAALSATTGAFSGAISTTDTTASSSATTGALKVSGGAGFAKGIVVGSSSNRGTVSIVGTSGAGPIVDTTDNQTGGKNIQFGQGINAAGEFDVYNVTDNVSMLRITSAGVITTANNLAVTGTLSSSGNFAINTNKFTVNASTGSVLSKYINVSLAGTEGTLLALWDDTVINCVTLTSVSTGGASGAATCITINKNSSTSRSINAAGTINAGGADYAEYERNNGLSITKGSIVGFKSDGTLTLTFSEAVRFGVKSTSPSYVGGDTWGSEDAVGERPVMPRDPTDEQKAKHATDTEAFNVRLEAARQQVDRIAYSGKVPCNVMGAAPGDYIIAAEDGNAITGEAIANPTFEQYRNAVGRVNKILSDGRAEIAVIVH